MPNGGPRIQDPAAGQYWYGLAWTRLKNRADRVYLDMWSSSGATSLRTGEVAAVTMTARTLGPVIGPNPGVTTAEHRSETTQELLVAAKTADPLERRRLHDEAVMLNLEIADSIARRYHGRGQEQQDLSQVARLALVKAVQRFDPDKGTEFVAFAAPTIAGEIKRFFRDSGWMIRIPRRMQELQVAIPQAIVELSQTLCRSPRAAEIAQYLDEDVEEVIEALAARGCFAPSSLDLPVGESNSPPLAELLGGDDAGFDHVEKLTSLAPACRQLKPREKRILHLRFYRGATQQEIADELGVTQMQVSRLLTGILNHLRERLGVATTGSTTKRARRATGSRRSSPRPAAV